MHNSSCPSASHSEIQCPGSEIGNDRIGSMRSLEIPSGTEVDVRLVTPLTSDTAQVEDRVEGTTMIDLYRGNDLIVPAGSVMTGWVTSVDRASRTDRQGKLTIEFNRVRINNRNYDTKAYVTQALESDGLKGEAGRIGAGSAVGAIIGGILGGVKGAVAGILIGGGGVIAATEGKDVHLPKAQKQEEETKKADPLVLSVTADNQIFVESNAVDENGLDVAYEPAEVLPLADPFIVTEVTANALA